MLYEHCSISAAMALNVGVTLAPPFNGFVAVEHLVKFTRGIC